MAHWRLVLFFAVMTASLAGCNNLKMRQPPPYLPADQVVDASWVVQVVACERRGNRSECITGSGYFLAPWLDTIVTARHVVTGSDTFDASRVEVFVHVWHRAATVARLRVHAYEHATGRDDDVAVVRLDGAVRSVNREVGPGEYPSFDFEAQLWGSPNERSFERQGPESIPLRAQFRPPFLEHIGREGERGFSGGPLVYRDSVVGTYRGHVDRRVSTPLDLEILEQLRNETSR